MKRTDIFHYPPDLFQLLVDGIPVLNKSKWDVILFFTGAGVSNELLVDLSNRVEKDKENINKYEIARTVLTRINLKSDEHLRERREILKRVTEFEAFTSLWPNDVMKAKGFVSEIRSIVNVKDSFTRMNQEREKERKQKTNEYKQKAENTNLRNQKLDKIKTELYSLFGEPNAQKRGILLECVLNELFKYSKISIKDSFAIKGNYGEGIIEQIDGVVEIDNRIFLVEMKWTKNSTSRDEIHTHLGRIFSRTEAYGIYISSSGYSESAKLAAKEAFGRNALLVLMELQEIVTILEYKLELEPYLRKKIQKAIIEKEPYWKP